MAVPRAGKGGSVFGKAKPMVGTGVHTPIGLLRKRAATLTGGLTRIFLMGLVLHAHASVGMAPNALFQWDWHKSCGMGNFVTHPTD